MNDVLQDFARQEILDGMVGLPESNHRLFKLMYGRNGGKRSVEDAEKMSIEDVIKEIPTEKLDWAMQQIQRTLRGK